MTEIPFSWSESPAGLVAGVQRAAYPGDDHEERWRTRAEEQREARAEWEARMDAIDQGLRAEGKLERTWRQAHAEFEARAWDGVVLEVPNSYVRFRPASWSFIDTSLPRELAALQAHAVAAQTVTTSDTARRY